MCAHFFLMCEKQALRVPQWEGRNRIKRSSFTVGLLEQLWLASLSLYFKHTILKQWWEFMKPRKQQMSTSSMKSDRGVPFHMSAWGEHRQEPQKRAGLSGEKVLSAKSLKISWCNVRNRDAARTGHLLEYNNRLEKKHEKIPTYTKYRHSKSICSFKNNGCIVLYNNI